MQRLGFLRESLPTWVERTGFRIVVVDYSCPEDAGTWAESEFPERVAVVRHAAEVREGRRVFNPSRARNAGAAAVRDGYVLFLDADVQVGAGFEAWMLEHLRPDVMAAVVGRPSALFGILGVHVDKWRAAGAYDEGFTGWGGEDLDLRIRLHLLGLACEPLPESLVRSLPHSNSLRSKNSVEPDFFKARALNGRYLEEKLQRMTGRSFASWIADAGVDCLLGRHGRALAAAAKNLAS
jgi:hypothetical protein